MYAIRSYYGGHVVKESLRLDGGGPFGQQRDGVGDRRMAIRREGRRNMYAWLRRRIGRVDDAKRCLSRRHEGERGTHIVDLRDMRGERVPP